MFKINKRPSWYTRREWVEERVLEALRYVTGRIWCRFGSHWVKFGTAPYCARCGREPRQKQRV